jgi:replicative superfamily II helicase
MGKSGHIADGSKVMCKSEDVEFEGHLESVDVSFERDEEMDAIGYAMHTDSSNSSEKIGMNVGYTERHLKLGGLQQISGVGRLKAEALYDGGYERVEDIKMASQEELSNVEGIGMALAARIKADVGSVGVNPDEIVDELEESTPSFLEENTLMVNIHE